MVQDSRHGEHSFEKNLRSERCALNCMDDKRSPSLRGEQEISICEHPRALPSRPRSTQFSNQLIPFTLNHVLHILHKLLYLTLFRRRQSQQMIDRIRAIINCLALDVSLVLRFGIESICIKLHDGRLVVGVLHHVVKLLPLSFSNHSIKDQIFCKSHHM